GEVEIAFASARGLGSYQLQVARLAGRGLRRVDGGGLMSSAQALLPGWGWGLVIASFLAFLSGWLWGRWPRRLGRIIEAAEQTEPSPGLSGRAAVRGLCLPEGESLAISGPLRDGGPARPAVPF